MLTAGLLALALHTAAPAVEFPLARPALRVVVRTDSLIHVHPDTLARVLEFARDIWRPYVDVTFVRGEYVRDAGFHGNTLDLIVTARTLAGRDPGSLGWIAFVDGRPSP